VSDLVRAGLIQQRWTGDKESMIAAAVEAIGKAASQGAQVICLQELFYGPYFCQVQDTDYYSYTEQIPDGPTTKLMQEVAERGDGVFLTPATYFIPPEQIGEYQARIIEAFGPASG